MLDYDDLDPAAYQRQYVDVARERYMDSHWRGRIEAAVRAHLSGRLLDLGCGFGNYLPSLRTVGRPVGVDLSLHWLEAARARGDELVRADARRLPFADASFDGVLSVGLLEYVDPAAMLAELARVLRVGGHAVLVAPNRNGIFRSFARALHRVRRVPYPCVEPTRAQLLRLFEQRRLRVMQMVRDDGLVWLPDAIDRIAGARTYAAVEALFRPFGQNPWSNLMLFVVERA